MESTEEVSCAPHSSSSISAIGGQHQQQEHQTRVLEYEDRAGGLSPLELEGTAAAGHSPRLRDREEVEASRTYKRLMLEDTASATSLRMGVSKQSRAAQVRLEPAAAAAVTTGIHTRIYCTPGIYCTYGSRTSSIIHTGTSIYILRPVRT